MTSPLSPETVAQMVTDLRAADKPLIQSGPFIQTRERLRTAADIITTLAAENATLRERADAITPLASVLVQFVTALADECDADLDDVVMSVRVMPEGREVAEVSATDIIAKVRALTPTADKDPKT